MCPKYFLLLLVPIIVWQQCHLCYHWHQERHQIHTIFTSCIGLLSLLFKFSSEDTEIAAFINNISGSEEKPLPHPVLDSGQYCYNFISKNPPTPLLLKTSSAWKIHCCDILSIFTLVPVWFLIGWINCYRFHHKSAALKTKNFSVLSLILIVTFLAPP